MPNFKKTSKQIQAIDILASDARHVLLRGGSRSGKSFILLYALIVRALKCKSRHVILRLHFNHVKQSIWLDTLPKVLELCFPDIVSRCKFDKADWYLTLPNGSEIWIGGLDDKERTEKILGKEFSTIWFNECSEITLESRNIALTRLAEKNELVKRAWYDCNPPKKTHWTHDLFIEHPDQGCATMLINPPDNLENIDPDYISGVLEKLPPLLRLRFLNGEFGSDETDIFKPEWLLPCDMPKVEDIAAVFSFCDPAVTSKELAKDDTCESAIVVLGVVYGAETIVDLEILHGFWEYQQLKVKCQSVHERYKGFSSFFFGSENIAAQQWLISDLRAMGINCLGLPPDSDKVRRAISVTDLLAQGRCRVNDLELRKQLLSFPGGKLKDITDAYVYALRLYKQYSRPRYEDPREKREFTGVDNATFQAQRVAKFQERKRRQAEMRGKGLGNDPQLGRKW